MRTVKIIQGAYGHRDKDNHVKAVYNGDVVDLDDKEAERIVSMGVAVYIDADISVKDVATAIGDEKESVSIDNSIDEEDGSNSLLSPSVNLKQMSYAELKNIAINMGIDMSGLKSKTKLLDAIMAKADEVEDDEELPVVEAENPLV